MRQGSHVCKDALLEGGDVIAMQGPEERRGRQDSGSHRDSGTDGETPSAERGVFEGEGP